jgi:DNA-binding CsgD family transcriptional regulator
VQSPSVFISYSHDTDDHKEWVYAFSSDLVLNGVNVTLDQWDLKPGQDIVSFMHKGIARADRVILICSDNYVQKADNGSGGVGYEKLIVSAELAAKTDTSKFIPIVRGNSTDRKLPAFMGARLYVDFDRDDIYSKRLMECLRDLHGLPPRQRPQLGAFAVPELMHSREGTGESPAPMLALTPRELEVLRWTLEGKTAWEVGAILNITERTAVLHLDNATLKLQAKNKHQAVLKALRYGLFR